MGTRKASVKETGEELSPRDWARFEAAAEDAAHEPPAEKARDQAEALGRPARRGPTDAEVGDADRRRGD